MPPKPYVVLDKSFLMGVNPPRLKIRFKDIFFVATESLLGECFQAFLPAQNKDEEEREQNIRALLKFADRNVCSLNCWRRVTISLRLTRDVPLAHRRLPGIPDTV